ncbi:protein takeout-like [Arctopsyche grandis]|uniref:protein takeout-like n=1 Tax=Arctopsyche grandis TaxID=121162 RepID=UPI00406D97FE
MKIAMVALLCLSTLYETNAVKLPSSFSRCKVSPELDNKPNECLRKALEDAMIKLSNDMGNSELGVLDLDPLKINKVVIEKGETSPVAIRLEYTDNDLTGLSKSQIKSVTGKLSSAKQFEMVITNYLEEVVLKGPYTVNGKVLILPIQGIGQSVMGLEQLTSKLTIKGEPQMKNGKEYLKITSLNLNMTDVGRLRMSMSDLFNGDIALGDNMNKFLNENWQDIYNELRPSIEGAFGAIFEIYAKRILERVQFKNIFLLD